MPTKSSVTTDIDETINVAYNLNYEYSLNCQTYASQMNYIYLDNCQNFTISDTTFSNQINATTDCMQHNSDYTDLDLDVNLTEQAMTLANSMVDGFEDYADSMECPETKGAMSYVTSTSCDFTYILNLTLNMLYSVKDAYSEDCSITTNSSSVLSCEDSDNVTYNNIDYDQYVDSSTKCIQENGDVKNSYDDLMAFVDANYSDSSDVAGDGQWIALIICVVLLIVFSIYYQNSFGNINNVSFIIVMVLVPIALIMGLGYVNNFWTSSSTDDPMTLTYDATSGTNGSTSTSTYSTNDTILIVATFIIFFIAMVATSLASYAKCVKKYAFKQGLEPYEVSKLFKKPKINTK
jgi:hypothetical protein